MFDLVLSLGAIFCLATVGWASCSLAPWVPTRKRDLERICKLAQFKPGEIFYDLGCGDGRLPLYAARRYGARGVGLELSLPLYLICRMRLIFHRSGKVKFKFKDLYRENLAEADVVYMFADSSRKFKGDLLAKLKNELKPGARVITYAFAVKEWVPDAVDKPSDKELSIYRYKI
jgi:cyclopropane fatty-acyl-phospholipid synthase-like methyltransferase